MHLVSMVLQAGWYCMSAHEIAGFASKAQPALQVSQGAWHSSKAGGMHLAESLTGDQLSSHVAASFALLLITGACDCLR